MRVAVIGAGIIGVTTAYELGADGHEVTVFDRCGGVAAQGSFANAGFVSPGYTTPWASPALRAAVLRQMWNRHKAVRWRASFDLAQWRWIARWWRACHASAYTPHRQALLALARASQARLRELTREFALDYERTQGVLVLFRSESEVAAARANLDLLRELEVNVVPLSPEQCLALEPDLNPQQPLAAGLHLPDDETGNCRQFAHLLRDVAEARFGVEFRFAADVTRIDLAPRRPTLRVEQLALTTGFAASHVMANGARDAMSRRAQAAARYLAPVNDEAFDAVVLCVGAGSAPLLRSVGVRLPLLPVYGYSATFGLRVAQHGPRSGLMDERYKVAITRVGSRVRVAGSAELGGDGDDMQSPALDTLYKVLRDWFPGAAHLARAQLWKGARPMLADGPPVIGPGPRPGVWLNLGHGSSGWSLACGSARLLADQITGRASALDAKPFGAERYMRLR
jgi:D-amino-acid dehydrogenase